MISKKLQTFLRPVDRLVSPNGVAPRPPGSVWRAILFGERFVVSRSLLHFERIQRPAGPVDGRIYRAVDLAARTRAPFNHPGVFISWGGRYAVAWSWDADRLKAFGVPSQAWVSPEPTLAEMDSLQSDGLRMRELSDGIEGQILQHGEIVASRYWRRNPLPDEVDKFLRAAAGQHSDDSDAQSLATGRLSFGLRRWAARLRPMHAALAALAVFGPILTYQFGVQARLGVELRFTQAELNAVLTESSTQFTALQAYQDARARLDQYRDALNLTHPLEPVVELAETAQAFDGSLQRFRVFPQGLEATLAVSNTEPAGIVRRLEEADSLTDVSISRAQTANQWDIRASMTAPEGNIGNFQ